MVKHQRRSHQRGLHPHELLDDCTSDSESGDSPTTPKHHGMQWSPHGVLPHHAGLASHGQTIHRAASFGDFGQHMAAYPMQQAPPPPPQHQHPGPYGHRHNVSAGGAHEFHSVPVPEPPQHPGVQMLHRTSSMPQHSFYVTEQGNPGVATMNTNPVPPQYQVPRQQVERLPIEIPYSAPGMNTSIQSSPSSFSTTSGRSPSAQDGGFYTHQPTQAATYALQAASPVEQPPPNMVQYSQQPMQQPINGAASQVPRQAPPVQAPPAPPSPEHYQQPSQPEPEHWYNGVPYQAPVEVATIVPAYGGGLYDPWGAKLDFEDTSMQLPSARIENM